MGWMGNCVEVLNEVAQLCENIGSEPEARHEHTVLAGDRAKKMERYSPGMIRAILRGLRQRYRNNRIVPGA